MKTLLFLIISVTVPLVINVEIEANVNTLLLNDGNVIPAIAFGTFAPIADEDQVEQSIVNAIEAGFRLINTAAIYDNEAIVGQAVNDVISRGVVTRKDLFITTELDMTVSSTEDVVPALQSALDRLKLTYIDLYLMRFPFDMTSYEEEDIIPIWKGMEMAKENGLTISIGVSNFNSSHINKILTYTTVRPAVNEFEVNPTSAELELAAYCEQQRIRVMSIAPFGFMASRPFRHISLPPTSEEPELTDMGLKYGKTPYQVLLRYLIDRGIIPIPGSMKEEHIQQNINVFDFKLTDKEVYIINEFNQNERVYPIDNPTVQEELTNYVHRNAD